RALRIAEERTGAVLLKGVELGFVERGLDDEGAADVHAELADVDAGDLLAHEELRLQGQYEFLVELGDLSDEHAECERQAGVYDFHWGEDFAELPARHCVHKFDEERLRFFDRGKERTHDNLRDLTSRIGRYRNAGRRPIYLLTAIPRGRLQGRGAGVGNERMHLGRIFAAGSEFDSRGHVDAPGMQGG